MIRFTFELFRKDNYSYLGINDIYHVLLKNIKKNDCLRNKNDLVTEQTQHFPPEVPIPHFCVKSYWNSKK